MAVSRRLSSPAETASSVEPMGEPVVPSQPVRRPRLLLVASILTSLWGIFVLALWLTSADPVILSKPQIGRADFIVTASRPDPRKNRLLIEQVWRGQLEPGELVILNLDKPAPHNMPAGKKFIVPLSRARGGLRITVLGEQSDKIPPLIYPETPDAIRQLQDLLAEKPQSPGKG